MKLASLVVLALLGGVAHADGPPARRQALRQFLIQNFDRNGDGRLEPRERRQAAKVLRKLARRMDARHERAARKQRFIRRFDANRDGNVGPGEMPRGLADELRPLDRDGNGWLENDELP